MLMQGTIKHSKNKTFRTEVKRKKTTPKKRGKTQKKERKVALTCSVAFAILALLSLFVIFLQPEVSESEIGSTVPSGYLRYAVDLSHHNPKKIVWDSLYVMTDKKGRTTRSITKASQIVPISYVILKASEGNTLRDSHFKSYWENADNRVSGRGAYHFFRTSKSPETQANNFINAVGKLKKTDLPPILDIETTHKGYSKEKLNTNVLVWLNIVEKYYGRKPIIYSSESYLNDILDNRITENYPIWVAHYREEKPEREGWMMWQFTDKAVVYGIDGPVDLNVINPDFIDD